MTESGFGLSTGLFMLDHMTGGYWPGQLIVVAGRPGSGKTSFATTTVISALGQGKVVGYFTLEGTRESVVARLLCARAMVDSNRFRTGYLIRDEWVRLKAALDAIKETQMFLEDDAHTFAEISGKASNLFDEHGVDLIVIDYAQLIRSDNLPFGYRLSRELKLLAKRLKVPVLVTCQLSAGKTERMDRRPFVADFRNDAALYEDADIVVFLHREEMYYATEENRGLAEAIVVKNRDGGTGTIHATFLREFSIFTNLWAEGQQPPTPTQAVTRDHLAQFFGHSQDHLIHLSVKEGRPGADCTVPIFKSPQERDFFDAVCAVYPELTVYPNVSLNCLIDFDQIKRELSREERSFFFKSSVDCVVFKDGRPVLFFELDSSYHDTPEQQVKDRYKDNIVALAGQKLHRIRRAAADVGRVQFEAMIREVFDRPESGEGKMF